MSEQESIEVKQDASSEDSAPHACEVVAEPLLMDSGLTAWLQVLGSWFIFMWTWGLPNTFGIFETYYIQEMLPHSSPSAISWIGSTQLFLLMIVGLLTGALLDRGHLRFVLVTGTFFEVFGMMMTSISTKYWQILLAQGICTGIGSGMLGLTSVGVIPYYFEKKRMIAIGIAATGSSLSGVLYPIMLQHLFPKVGFGWSVRILAFMMLGTLLIPIAVMKQRIRPQKRPPPSLSVLKDIPFAIFVACFSLMIMSVYVPFFYIQVYAIEIGVEPQMAFYLLAIMNASSFIGRLLPNFFADYVGGLTIMIPCCFFSAVLIFLFRVLSSQAGFIAMAVFYGIISGSTVSLPPAIVANITDDHKELGTRMGIGYVFASFGALIGNPVSGAAQRGTPIPGNIESVQKHFEGSWYFAGSIMAVTTLLVVATWLERRRLGKGTKA